MFGDDFIPLEPVNFFALSCDCYYHEYDPKKDLGSKFILPDTSGLCGEDTFAEVAMAWSNDGITIQVKVDEPCEHVSYSDVTQGDSVELFFDTRDVKTSGYNTRYCHHFFFLPKEIDEHIAGEKTHFRTEDVHELCDPKQLKVISSLKKSSYTLKIFLPSQCLYGYDPEQFDRLGFTYRINRFNGIPQHFSVVSQEYQLEQQPSLWSSVRLIHGNGTK